jgi:hypothetical protein
MRWQAVLVGIAIGIGGCGDDDGGQIPVDGGVAGPDGSTVVTDGGGTGPGVRPMPAGDIFDDTHVHEISLTMSADDWQSIIDDTRADE